MNEKPDQSLDNAEPAAAKGDLIPAQSYLCAWTSFQLSQYRLDSAYIVFLSLRILLRGDKEVASYVGHEQLPGVREKNFEYVCAASFLMYAVAAFDSFLSDTAKFLLFSKPDALGQSCVVPIGTLASPKARAAVLNKEIGKKVRSLSMRCSLEERIDFLCQNFGLTYRPSEADMSSLRSHWELRNQVAHDQSVFGFELDETQQNRIVIKGQNIVTPTAVSYDLGRRAVELHDRVAEGICRSVLRDFLRIREEEVIALTPPNKSPRDPRLPLSDKSVATIRAMYDFPASPDEKP